MLIRSNKLAVSPITTHINIKNVAKNINKNLIINKIKTINNCYKSFLELNLNCILGLNPHNSELEKTLRK